MDTRYFCFYFRKKYWPLFLQAADRKDALRKFERIRWRSKGNPFFERYVPEIEEYRHKYQGVDAYAIKPLNYQLVAVHRQDAKRHWHTVEISQSRCTENSLFLVFEETQSFRVENLTPCKR